MHSGLDLPDYEDLDIEFFFYLGGDIVKPQMRRVSSALVKLLRRLQKGFLLLLKRCRALFWFPIDPSPLNVVVLLKPFGHVKNLL